MLEVTSIVVENPANLEVAIHQYFNGNCPVGKLVSIMSGNEEVTAPHITIKEASSSQHCPYPLWHRNVEASLGK